MFGESESESPRTGSPWDGFLSKSDPASPAAVAATAASVEAPLALTRSPRVVPKLVPEVEEGNVEYKLRLLAPPPERFARLVTQLKWRLLEGGGQAYYELGVADSGALVGLSRAHLEMSLMTLEEMAGEIGASVVVVKEIELPAALVGDEGEEGGKGEIADGAMRMPKRRVEEFVDRGSPESVGGFTPTDAEYETELSTPEAEDEPDKDGEIENEYESAVATLVPRLVLDATSKSATATTASSFSRRTHAHTNARPVRLSPADPESYDSASGDDCGVFAGDLEIASVYKPRPHRRRTPASAPPLATTATAAEYGRPAPAPSAPVDVPAPLLGVRGGTGRSRKEHRRERARAMGAQVPIPRLVGGGKVSHPGSAAASVGDVDVVATRAVDELEVAAAAFKDLSLGGEDNSSSGGSDSPVCAPVPQVAVSGAPADALQARHTGPGSGYDSKYGYGSNHGNGHGHGQGRGAETRGSDLMYKGRLVPDDARLRRYIVEALVVRKMALDEVFLDFVNF